MTDEITEQVTWFKSARVGYTKCINVAVGYHIHQNYMLVEYVLEHISKKTLNTKNKNNLNIIEYMDAKINEQKSIIMKDHVNNQLAPLKNTIKHSM